MKRIFFCLLLMIILICATAQKERQRPPQGGQPKDFTLPAPVKQKLANGLQYTLVQYGNIPKVTVSVVVKTGNVHEEESQIWLADLTANMIKEGTESLQAAEISRQAAGMGGEVEISVSSGQTILTGSVLSEFAPDLIRLLAEMVMHPSFPESSLPRLKDDQKRYLAVSKTIPQAIAHEKFAQSIFEGGPYGRVYPTEAMLNGYSLNMVKSFYEKQFGAKRTVVYVAGLYDTEDVAGSITTHFSSWKEGPDVSYPPIKVQRQNKTEVIDRRGAPQSTIVLGMPAWEPNHNQYVEQLITHSLLGGFFGSRITSNIREDKGYTYSPHSSLVHYKNAAVWYEEADVSSEHTGAALQEISKEITRLQEEPPGEEELLGVKQYNAGVFVLQNSSPDGIIGQLNFMDLHGLDETFLTDRVKKIYAVTPETVSQIAKELFRYDDMTLVIVGDKEEIEKQMKEYKVLQKL